MFYWKLSLAAVRAQKFHIAIAIASAVCGYSGLSAVGYLQASVYQSFRSEARSLLGADLIISRSEPLPTIAIERLKAIAHSVEVEQVYKVYARNPRNGVTRLVELHAVPHRFPLIESLSSAEPWSLLEDEDALIADAKILLSLNLQIGEQLEIQGRRFILRGQSPPLFGYLPSLTRQVPALYGKSTSLTMVRPHQLSAYRYLVTLTSSENTYLTVNMLEKEFGASLGKIESVSTVRARYYAASKTLGSVLRLVGLAALVLSCIALAISYVSLVEAQRAEYRLLFDLGASRTRLVALGIGTLIVIGFTASVLGTLAGSAIAKAVLVQLGGVYGWGGQEAPVASYAIRTIGLHLWLSSLALFFPARHLLSTIRWLDGGDASHRPAGFRSSFLAVVYYVVTAASVFAYVQYNLQNARMSAGFIASFALAVGAFVITSVTLLRVFRSKFGATLSFEVFYAFAQLSRASRLTSMIFVALGLGMFLMATIHLAQSSLSEKLASTIAKGATFLCVSRNEADVSEIKHLLARYSPQFVDGAALVDIHIEMPEHGDRAREKRRFFAVLSRDLLDGERLSAGSFPPSIRTSKVAIAINPELFPPDVKLGTEMRIWNGNQTFPAEVVALRDGDGASLTATLPVIVSPDYGFDLVSYHALWGRFVDMESQFAFENMVNDNQDVQFFDLSAEFHETRKIVDAVLFAVGCVSGLAISSGAFAFLTAFLFRWKHLSSEMLVLRTLGMSSKRLVGIILIQQGVLFLTTQTVALLVAKFANQFVLSRAFAVPPGHYTTHSVAGYYATVLFLLVAFGLCLFNTMGRGSRVR